MPPSWTAGGDSYPAERSAEPDLPITRPSLGMRDCDDLDSGTPPAINDDVRKPMKQEPPRPLRVARTRRLRLRCAPNTTGGPGEARLERQREILRRFGSRRDFMMS